jgi:hypothetical protein
MAVYHGNQHEAGLPGNLPEVPKDDSCDIAAKKLGLYWKIMKQRQAGFKSVKFTFLAGTSKRQLTPIWFLTTPGYDGRIFFL